MPGTLPTAPAQRHPAWLRAHCQSQMPRHALSSHLVKEQLPALLLPEVHHLDSHLAARVLFPGQADNAGGAFANLHVTVQQQPGVALVHHHPERSLELLMSHNTRVLTSQGTLGHRRVLGQVQVAGADLGMPGTGGARWGRPAWRRAGSWGCAEGLLGAAGIRGGQRAEGAHMLVRGQGLGLRHQVWGAVFLRWSERGIGLQRRRKKQVWLGECLEQPSQRQEVAAVTSGHRQGKTGHQTSGGGAASKDFQMKQKTNHSPA